VLQSHNKWNMEPRNVQTKLSSMFRLMLTVLSNGTFFIFIWYCQSHKFELKRAGSIFHVLFFQSLFVCSFKSIFRKWNSLFRMRLLKEQQQVIECFVKKEDLKETKIIFDKLFPVRNIEHGFVNWFQRKYRVSASYRIIVINFSV